MSRALSLAAVVIIAGIIAACGSDDDSTSTSLLSEAANEAVIEVSFDGSGCTADGPSTIPAGEHSFLLTDTTDRFRTEMWVRYLTDGHTYQDILDLQNDAGGPGTYIPHPEFVVHAPMTRPQSSPSDNQLQYHHALEPGPHALVVGGNDVVWLCGSFDVTES